MNAEQRQQILAKNEAGLSARQIAVEMNINKARVLGILREEGIDIRRGKLTDSQKSEVICLRTQGVKLQDLSDQFGVTVAAIHKLCSKASNQLNYFDTMTIDGTYLDRPTIRTLSTERKEALVPLILAELRKKAFNFTDAPKELHSEMTSLFETQVAIENDIITSYKFAGTHLCKYFCKEYYDAKISRKISLREAYQNNDMMVHSIRHNLGLTGNYCLSITFPSLIRNLTAANYCGNISVFKPVVARAIYDEFSEPGDTVYDYSAGWGARMLGAWASGRNYIATDPLTIPSLQKMSEYFKKSPTLFHHGSEIECLPENSVDLAFSSPPYYDVERYSEDKTQARIGGEQNFYNHYWHKTLQNVRKYLKPEKYFVLNVLEVPRMVQMAIDAFGQPVRTIQMETSSSRKDGSRKYEPIFVFRNGKEI